MRLPTATSDHDFPRSHKWIAAGLPAKRKILSRVFGAGIVRVFAVSGMRTPRASVTAASLVSNSTCRAWRSLARSRNCAEKACRWRANRRERKYRLCTGSTQPVPELIPCSTLPEGEEVEDIDQGPQLEPTKETRRSVAKREHQFSDQASARPKCRAFVLRPCDPQYCEIAHFKMVRTGF